jgi:hypothetical protein
VIGAFDGLPFADACIEGLSAIADRNARAKILLPTKGIVEYRIASVDIDSRMRADYPNANRWDYAVSHGSPRKGSSSSKSIQRNPAKSMS